MKSFKVFLPPCGILEGAPEEFAGLRVVGDSRLVLFLMLHWCLLRKNKIVKWDYTPMMKNGLSMVVPGLCG